MAAREQKPFDRLEALTRATDDLRPTNDFSDAFMATIETSSAASVLDKARRETADLAPTDDFVAAIMQSVEQGRGVQPNRDSEWHAPIVRFSRFALVAAAAAAAFCLWLSSRAETRFNATLLEDVATLEVDE